MKRQNKEQLENMDREEQSAGAEDDTDLWAKRIHDQWSSQVCGVSVCECVDIRARCKLRQGVEVRVFFRGYGWKQIIPCSKHEHDTKERLSNKHRRILGVSASRSDKLICVGWSFFFW